MYLMFCLLTPTTLKAKKQPFGDGLYWELSDNGILTISGNGFMPDYNGWMFEKLFFEKVIIEEGVLSIGANSFTGNSRLKTVIISNSVKSIGEHAFRGCDGLFSVEIPNSVKIIDQSAFSGCTKLGSIIIPNSVLTIGRYAFSGCKNLNITILNADVAINGPSFMDCMVTIVNPRPEKTYGPNAFRFAKRFSRLYTANKKSFSIFKEGDSSGLVNSEGKWVIPMGKGYFDLDYLTDNLVKFRTREYGHYGVLSIEGKEIVPCELDNIEPCGNNYLRYELNGFWGVMDYQGKILIDTDRGYTSIGDYKSFNKRFAYTMAGYKGECDATGRQISKIKVETSKQNTSVASSSGSSSSSSSASSSSSNSNSGNNTTTIHVEHHRDPVPVQEWVQCTACWGSGTCPDCAGSGTKYVGDNLKRCWRCGGRGKCSSCSGHGGRYYTVYK